ncbi:MAG TPA: formate dehydrogenase subunit gamma [Gammaproteobacteria bacterium]|nr:formate dehydrogenase subunit gamma [Gammaproteobacteria bacterium]
MPINKQSRIRRHRMVVFSLLSLLVLTLVLPLIPYAVAELGATTGKVVNPGAELWRDVRQRDRTLAGSTQVRGVDTAILINVYGEDWRVFRMQRLIPYGAALMGAVLSVILLFYLVRGPLRMQGGPAGNRIQRFTVFERTTHWFTVSVFWLLALTGLILLYGRYVLIPLLGPDGFGLTASACKEAHNLFGPMFLVAILMLFVTFVKDNIYARGDMTWLLKGGGMLGGGHVSAGRFNAGEKIWFWIAVLGGSVLCVTGLILDFAVFGQGREVMALSHVLHGIVALIVISVSFGHIYLGTAGVEGTLGSMTTGYVDEAWAKSHHDRWYAEVKASAAGQGETEPAGGGSAATGVTSPARDG